MKGPHMRRFLTALMTLGLLLIMLPAVAAPQEGNCPKDYDYTDLNTDQSGAWGSITVDGAVLDIEVSPGWTVDVCLKAGDQFETTSVIGPDTVELGPILNNGGQQAAVSHFNYTPRVSGSSTTLIPIDPSFVVSQVCGGPVVIDVFPDPLPDGYEVGVLIDGQEAGFFNTSMTIEPQEGSTWTILGFENEVYAEGDWESCDTETTVTTTPTTSAPSTTPSSEASSTSGTLPFTGSDMDAGQIGRLAMSLLAMGGLILLLVKARTSS